MATSTESDKYDVLDKIGHGSFGIIRKVRRKTDGKIICRKEISYVKMSHKEREQLNAEISILGSLRHPNIVAYYHRDHLKSSQELHLYMEYCGGGDLADYIKKLKETRQNAPEEFVWMVFSQLVTALHRCHYGKDAPAIEGSVMAPPPADNEGLRRKSDVMILHRDLKPDNIFLNDDNEVKLGDFGLSKLMQSHDYASTYVGTPYYMSPEICAAERYTLQSDIWSLGCIVYELCTQRPPFDARSHLELIGKIKAGRYDPIGPAYSRELADVVASCLRTNPHRRPVTRQLVHMPVVRLCRKERDMVALGRALRQREADAALKAAEAQQLHARLARDVARARDEARAELDASVRREWEVKARLEIDRQVAEKVEQEMQRLRAMFDDEVHKAATAMADRRVAEALAEMRREALTAPAALTTAAADSVPTSSFGSTGASSAAESPTTDLTSLSLDSPSLAAAHLRKKVNGGPSTRTPFSRARTQIDAPSPMDVQMTSPSPRSIASLSLSPRRAQALARGLPQGNLFGQAPSGGTATHSASGSGAGPSALASVPEGRAPAATEWRPHRQPSPDRRRGADSEDEDEPVSALPLPDDLSPTRPPRRAGAPVNPFDLGPTRPARPALARQATAPAPRPALGGAVPQPSLFTKADRPGATSPGRLAGAGGGAENYHRGGGGGAGGFARAFTTGAAAGGGEEMFKAVTQKNMLGGTGEGRTLVELQQARAAETRPPAGDGAAPTWDPADIDAPSPFLKRVRPALAR